MEGVKIPCENFWKLNYFLQHNIPMYSFIRNKGLFPICVPGYWCYSVFLVPFSGSGHSWFTMWPHLVTEPVIYLIPFFLQKRRPTSRPAPKSNGCGGWGCTRGQSQGSYRYEPRELFTYVLFQGGHLEFFLQISFWNESVILTLPSKNSAQHHHSSYGAGFMRNVPEIFL